MIGSQDQIPYLKEERRRKKKNIRVDETRAIVVVKKFEIIVLLVKDC